MQRWPLSLTQEGYARRLRGLDARPVNVTLALGLDATPPEVVESRLTRIAEREPLLRASLPADGSGTLTIAEPREVRLSVTEGVAPEALEEHLQHDTQHVFAADEPLWRPRLLRLTDGTDALSLNFHHIVFDGVSRGLFLRALAEPGTPPTADGTTYDRFARWQHDRFARADRDADFWRGYLDGWAHNQHVNLGFARNLDRPLDHACLHETVQLTGVRLWEVLRWGRRRGVSLFTQVLAALSVALGEATGEPENPVRATFHGRPPGFERTLGCFGQDVVVRLPTKSVGLEEALASAKRSWNELGDHRFTPYRLVRQAVGGWSQPFRPVIVTLNSFSTPTGTEAFGRPAAVLDVPELIAEEGLHIQLSQAANTVTLDCSYHPVRFSTSDVQEFLGRVTTALQEPH
jgi:hypothetical protein